MGPVQNTLHARATGSSSEVMIVFLVVVATSTVRAASSSVDGRDFITASQLALAQGLLNGQQTNPPTDRRLRL